MNKTVYRVVLYEPNLVSKTGRLGKPVHKVEYEFLDEAKRNHIPSDFTEAELKVIPYDRKYISIEEVEIEVHEKLVRTRYYFKADSPR